MPIVFYARGPLSSLLLSLELTEYCEFIAIENQYIWSSPQVLIPLPLSKEQVMLEPSLTLLEKRKLGKLLGLFVAAVIAASPENVNISLGTLLIRENLPPESRVFQLIAYGACRCASLEEVNSLPIKSAVKILESLRQSTNYLDKKAQSPFVIPIWGSSELSQAACRKAAVFGCTQILGKSIKDVHECGIKYGRAQENTPNSTEVVRKTFLLNRPILGINGSALITIPPQCDLLKSTSPLSILQLTSDSKCCPSGTWLIHLWSLEAIESNGSFMEYLIDSDSVLWQSCEENLMTELLPASHTSESNFVDTIKLAG